MSSCLQTVSDWTQNFPVWRILTPYPAKKLKLNFQFDCENPHNVISNVCFGENITLTDCVDPRLDCMSCAV